MFVLMLEGHRDHQVILCSCDKNHLMIFGIKKLLEYMKDYLLGSYVNGLINSFINSPGENTLELFFNELNIYSLEEYGVFYYLEQADETSGNDINSFASELLLKDILE